MEGKLLAGKLKSPLNAALEKHGRKRSHRLEMRSRGGKGDEEGREGEGD